MRAPFEQKLSGFPLLSDDQRRQVLLDWNQTQVDYPRDRCLHELVQEQAQRTPDATAVVFEGQCLTYRQLNGKANQLARHLRDLGVGPDVLVGICVERSLEMVIGLLGILNAGGAYLPLDPGYPKERLAYMLEDSQVSVLLTEARLVELLAWCPARIICLDHDWSRIDQESTENVGASARAHLRELTRRHRMKPCDGTVVFVRAMVDALVPGYHVAEDGWGELLFRRFQVEEIQCTHVELGREPHVGEVGRKLDKYLFAHDIEVPKAEGNINAYDRFFDRQIQTQQQCNA
jgi:hypothetical protein